MFDTDYVQPWMDLVAIILTRPRYVWLSILVCVAYFGATYAWMRRGHEPGLAWWGLGLLLPIPLAAGASFFFLPLLLLVAIGFVGAYFWYLLGVAVVVLVIVLFVTSGQVSSK